MLASTGSAAAGNTNQQFTQVGGCNPGPQNVGPQYPQLAPNVGPSCTTLGGSVYNDFTTWDSPIPSNLVYAIYFAPYNEAPQVGAQGDTLNTTVLSTSPCPLTAGAAQPTRTDVMQNMPFLVDLKRIFTACSDSSDLACTCASLQTATNRTRIQRSSVHASTAPQT